jgi:hypothetical protein
MSKVGNIANPASERDIPGNSEDLADKVNSILMVS